MIQKDRYDRPSVIPLAWDGARRPHSNGRVVLHDLVGFPTINARLRWASSWECSVSCCVGALGGYLASQRSRTTFAAIGAGVTTAVVSIGNLWLTFITLNRVFTDRISYEPIGFAHSRRAAIQRCASIWTTTAGQGRFRCSWARRSS